MLLSPFRYNAQNGFVHVPVETFKEVTALLIELAVATDAQTRDLAAAPIGHGQA
ncbi:MULTISPECIES: hypothetical protein [Pseudomonas]|uniref:hypothetical protein n=1 Tax=Pseudomonadaceae TaxID=135621 RepID=UPI000425B37F|nr:MULTISPECIES: hypothetical protein [Pseudomonas]